MSLPLTDKIALVTGASRGIGRASALALATAGAHVVAVARTQGGLEELDDEIRKATGQSATLVPMDIAEGDGLDQLGLALHQRFGRLDILVHAAAILGPLTPVSHLEPKHWDRVMAVNVTASYRAIRSFEPLLRASEAGRVVYVTTSVAHAPKAFWGAYAATKAGAEALIKCWADEIESTPVRASIVDPGRMRTQLRAQAYPGEDPETVTPPSTIGPLMVELARGDVEPPLEVSFREWSQGPGVAALI
jgi:NAD(P)-dependent dehydrogenase (short-subunit alcohol dehydrogenase family)